MTEPFARRDAPWTADEVDSLNAYQACGYFHEFTSQARTVLIATADGWVETQGGRIVQTWAHAFMCDWSWRKGGTRL